LILLAAAAEKQSYVDLQVQVEATWTAARLAKNQE